MKNRFFLFLLPVLLSLPSARGGEQILFNGENLEGWSGDPHLWRVENGILIGETDSENRQIPQNTFLIWENGEPENFELSLKVRVTGDNNSGVQYRSKTVENEDFLLHGYQMDVHPNQEYNAMLYEEGGRGILALRGESVIISENGERKTERIVEQIPKVDLAKWNDYRVVAQGDTSLHYLNGELATKITDRESGKFSRKGKIGLQLHAGPPMKLEAKEIRLKNLPKSENAEKPIEEAAISPKPAPEWVWSRKEAKTGEKIFLRHKIKTRKKVAGATILASGDDRFQLSINDHFIGKSESWQTPSRFDATEAFSGKNEHLIFIQAENEAGPAAFVFQLEL